MTPKNQQKSLVMLQAMIVSADRFHLRVAKALLSDEPLSSQQKAALRDEIAKRESAQEKQEALLKEMAAHLNSGDA